MKFTLIFSAAFLASISFVNGVPVKAAAPAALEIKLEKVPGVDLADRTVFARGNKPVKDIRLDTDLQVKDARGLKPPSEVDPDVKYADGKGANGFIWIREANHIKPGVDVKGL